MSTILGITVRSEEGRVSFFFDRSIADEAESTHEIISISPEFKAALYSWDGVTEVDVNEEDLWSLSFKLRTGVSLERALEAFVLILVDSTSFKHVIVRV